MRTAFPYCFFLILFSAGCEKNDTQPNSDETFMNAYSNNSEFWISNDPYASLSKENKIIWIGGYKTTRNGNDEDARLLLMQLEITDLSDLKKTTIKNAQYESILGGDVVTDRYTLDMTDTSNTIIITEIDETNKIIKGQFNLSLIRDAWFSGNGEKIEFKSGKFVTNYTKE